MIKPSIHLNGTGRENLHMGYLEAYRAVNIAIAAMLGCAPHARDYYTQGDLAFETALDEHRERVLALTRVRTELHELVLHTMRDAA